ncbi:MAG: class I SAM-dependent methyltransferase [Myxococcales bacterium]|nr:class I SAM-dependent methyltransferase [Myxococcales bacterium]
MAAALKGPQRSEENRARDPYRHPAETLAFFGLAPHMTVVEIRPGGGWYAEILAPALKEKGKYVAAVPSADGKRAKYRQRFIDMQAERADVLGAAEIVTFDPPTPIDLGPDGSADMVLTFRNTHNWIGDGGEKEAYAAFFRVLKPGGILGVVQHRADDGADPKQSAKKGYVPESYVIEVAQAAGFRLVDRSDINRNPKDTHDHPEGVWTLPPVLRLGDTDRAKYEAIGESDRMTLKFEKPL